jgi:predicted transposase YdaD
MQTTLFAVLSQTNDPTMVLTKIAKAVEAISDRQLQRNIATASVILAGLVLNKNVISKILRTEIRTEIMRESVIYQQILEEGEAKVKAETTRKLALSLL